MPKSQPFVSQPSVSQPIQPVTQTKTVTKTAAVAQGKSFSNASGWRIEVNGKYYHWRKGTGRHGQKKEYRKGGKFADLSEERKQAYYERTEKNN